MPPLHEEHLERIISRLLLSGVILAAAVVLLGGVCYLARHGDETPNYHTFHSTAPEYRSVRGVIQAAGPANCQAVIQLGLLILIATPIARVAFSLVSFAWVRDWTYVLVSCIVLAILVYSNAFEH